MPRYNRCMFVFMSCSVCVGVCGYVCCIAAVVKDFEPWSFEVCCTFV